MAITLLGSLLCSLTSRDLSSPMICITLDFGSFPQQVPPGVLIKGVCLPISAPHWQGSSYLVHCSPANIAGTQPERLSHTPQKTHPFQNRAYAAADFLSMGAFIPAFRLYWQDVTTSTVPQLMTTQATPDRLPPTATQTALLLRRVLPFCRPRLSPCLHVRQSPRPSDRIRRPIAQGVQ